MSCKFLKGESKEHKKKALYGGLWDDGNVS